MFRVILLLAVLLAVTAARASTIFESGTLGPTGIPRGEVDRTAIRDTAFNGVRFELTQPVRTTQVGGHFVDSDGGSFFGAIVALDDENDFPDSGDLSTDDVMGFAQLTFPVPSDEVFGDVDVRLEPGWYALVFGSGLFETSGQGAAPRNNPDIGEPSYINWQPGTGWRNLTNPIFRDHHFALNGNIVAEPPTLPILFLFALLLACVFRRHFACFMHVRRSMRPAFAMCIVLSMLHTQANAVTLLEAGTSGPSGISRQDVADQVVLGLNVTTASFQGVRFETSEPWRLSEIGGHFVGPTANSETFFGVIVQLDDEADFPDSSDLSTPDVLGSTLAPWRDPSADTFGALDLRIEPGWYALVFGGGLFEATGTGAALFNNVDNGIAGFIGYQRGFGWGERPPGLRFVVNGQVVPEPSSTVSALITASVLLLCRFHWNQ